MVQKLKLQASKAGDRGSIPGWEAEIPHAAWPKKKKKSSIQKGKTQEHSVLETQLTWILITHLPLHAYGPLVVPTMRTVHS